MKKAYTLSEVLVVLLVLGIIAAFIIPAVLRTSPDRASLLYKKTFYSLQEATAEMMKDPNMYPVTIDEEGKRQGGLFSDGFKFCNNLAETFDILEVQDCTFKGTNGKPNFTTTNGVTWYNLGSGSSFGKSKDNYIDIGIGCVGTDYRIRVYADGRVGTDESWDTENNILKKPFTFREL